MKKIGRKSGKLEAFSGTCDLQSGFELLPMAAFVLTWEVFRFLEVAAVFPPRMILAALGYVTGLIVLDKKQTALAIAGRLGALSHDQLTRLKYRDRWTCSALMLALLRFAASFQKRGWLIVDDILIPRPRAKKVQGAYWDHDHSENRHVFGHRFVVLAWSNGELLIPLAFALWHKKGVRPRYHSKNAIARILIRWALLRGLKVKYVTFDSWYASVENMRFLRSRRLHFVTRIKSNKTLFRRGQKTRADRVGAKLLRARRPYVFRDLGAEARGCQVDYPRFGPVFFVVVKNDTHEEQGRTKYMVTDALSVSARETLLRYRSRWAIEVFFRDARQHLGFASCHDRELGSIMRHVALVFLAYVCLECLKETREQTIGDAKKTLQTQWLVKGGEGEYRVVRSRPATKQEGQRVIEQADRILEELHAHNIHTHRLEKGMARSA